MANATGANTTPLGRLNPALNVSQMSGLSSLLKPSYMGGPPQAAIAAPPASHAKRERDDDNNENYSRYSHSPDIIDKKKKRRSRWGGDDKDKVFIPGMPTVLPNNLSPDQERAYLLQLQIEEISRRLRTGDLGISPNPEERSPSPEPIYNSEGKRLNTREYRTRKRLDDDRHSLIQEMFKVNPEYKPPADYKPPMIRVCEKVMIPQEEHPDINFVGLLIGPRGNTLKSMEKETGAKIIIRGKGSVKEGKVGRKDGQPLPGEDEPLHAFVTATNPDAVKRAVDKIKDIIRQGVEVPEGQNDLRRMQLRELALLNGTLREIEGPRCTNCGATNHRSWQCPDKPNITNNVICTNCGGAGHIARDCREKKVFTPAGTGGGGSFTSSGVDKSKIDEEYMSLMAELGEGPPPPSKSSSGGGYNSGPSLLSGSQGAPRAIMAPPPSNNSSQMSNQNWMQPMKQSVMNAVPPPGQSGQMQMSNMIGPPVGVPPPPGTTSQMSGMMMAPWQQQQQGNQGMGMNQAQMYSSQGMMGMQGVNPAGMMGHNGSQQMGQGGMHWMSMHQPGHMQMGNPWQQAQGMGSGQMSQGGQGNSYSWMGYMGMPPPPPGGGPPLPPGIGGPPPPPPPPTTTSMSGGGSNVDLAVLAQGLPNLLAAPPPPPPPS